LRNRSDAQRMSCHPAPARRAGMRAPKHRVRPDEVHRNGPPERGSAAASDLRIHARASRCRECCNPRAGRPCLAARSVAPLLGISISGAGKLLERAARLGLLIQTSGRETWRSYVTPDVALALGLNMPDRGRPRCLPRTTPAMETVLEDFDTEMAAIDARLERLALSSASGVRRDCDSAEPA